ncbi:UvrB/UvrC motif-containing protein [Calycomorphotria hydatis]|uniref:UvrB/uvrC motif protein n=1 Tax=Calycomorphotria hydatis TaxID=2528027 RepID=A0A517T8Y8_9PLAN|nr:UvrB/UvrC motif-containing protein [Calycomorphotria hydatis]QDT64844.1 UvrB/uvrC motif protein [Calycomorphotria hydatis]
MKKCHICSKPAVYHITELSNGEVVELHFCEEHFHEYMTQGESNSDPETEVSLPLEEADRGDDASEEIHCPNCGISFKEFREQGRFGCPFDYEIFSERLIPLLENIHGETQHTGKIPKRAPQASRRQYELIRLRKELAIAIDKEDYEGAAQLRDEIRSFEEDKS